MFSNGLTAYLLCIVAITGLSMGSFLQCLSDRVCNNESIAKGRSHCPYCNHTLGARELIPVVSYCLQGGTCRHCGVKIPLRYPLSEVVTMVVFLSIAMQYSYSLETIKYTILACILLVAVFSDIETMMIPDGIHVLAMVNWLVFALLDVNSVAVLKRGLLGGVSFFIGMMVLVTVADALMKKETMGGADIKLFVVTGFYFGVLANLLLLMISCGVGILFAGITGNVKKQFPFGPSIAIAAWMIVLYGETILTWYLGFF